MENDNQNQWERFLTPQVLRSNMITATVYIATFEILKDSIIDRLRNFYWTGWDEKGQDIVAPKYASDVLSRNKNQVYASLFWLKENKAITDGDIKIFENIKSVRNNIAHEINRLMMDGLPSELPERFTDMVSLLSKIEKWWIVNVEIPTNPDFDGKEIDEEGIIPGPVAGIKMMIDIALGTDEEAEFYIKGFQKQGLIKPRPK